MGKKPKNDIPNPSNVSNRDVIQRLNFLYQASVYLNNVHSSSSSTHTVKPSAFVVAKQHLAPKTGKRNKRKRNKEIVNLNDLSRSYVQTLKAVGTKTTVQLDPSVKRTLCKGCDIVLVPGLTTSVRTKKSSTHGHIMVYTCTTCKYSYRIPAAPIFRIGEAPAASDSGAVAMDIDAPQAQTEMQSTSQVDLSQEQEQDQQKQQIKSHAQFKKRKKEPRLPPLFARDAGHVVFAGNAQLPNSDGSWNDGIYIT